MKKTDFNRGWSVRKDGSSEVRSVNLPDDAMIREKRSRSSRTGGAGAFFEEGCYLYKKIFGVSEEDKEKTVLLEFEGVYRKAEVSLNGEKLFSHPYGYTGFFVDLTGKVQAGENELAVIADNSKVPNSRWYSGSGIYREVSLYQSGAEYIKPDGIRVRTISGKKVAISVDSVCEPDCSITLNIYDGSTLLVSGDLPAGQKEVLLQVPGAHLWSDTDPFLYHAEAVLRRDEKILDTDSTEFGIRTLAWNGAGLSVNGSAVLLRGACVHHDNGILGACAFRDAEERRVQILKESGFNAIRSAHNPISKAMLSACDRLGLYVMDECFDMWLVHKNPHDYAGEEFQNHWKSDLESMISKDYSHPSVIMYSIGNEISELGRKDGQDMAGNLAAYCHELDSSRPVTAGINLALCQMAAMKKAPKITGETEEKGNDDTEKMPTSAFFNMLMEKLGQQMDKAAATKKADRIMEILRDILDIPGLNYATSRYRKDGKKYPEKAFVGSETFTDGLYDNWQLVKEIPQLIGDFIWTGYDYLGESGIGTVRYLDRRTKKDIDPGLIICGGTGVIDICGKKRPEVGWGKTIYSLSEGPFIGVDPYTHTEHFKSRRMWRTKDTIESWSWEGCEGKKADVSVYSSACTVELFVNDRSLGKIKPQKNIAVFKKVPYEGGEIRAVNLDRNGKKTGEAGLSAAIGKTSIRLTPQKTELSANGQDIVFVQTELVGDNGVVKSSSDTCLFVTVEGCGSLQAFGSARPNMAESFVSDSHTTYYGKALLAVRAGYEAGEIKIRVRGDGLETAELKVEVKEA